MASNFLSRPGFLLVFTLLLAPSRGFAAKPRSLEIGLSQMSYQLNTMTTSPTGKKNTLGTSFYHLALQYHQPVSHYLWSPWLHYMPEAISAIKSPNNSSKTSLLAFGTPLTFNMTPYLDLGTGPVIMRYTVHGSGKGTEVMNNGSSTLEFRQPTESRTATTLAWQLGGGFNYGNFRAAGDLLLHGILSSKKRSVSVMVTGTWIVLQMGGGV